MKKLFFILVIMIALIEVNAQSVFRTYSIKFLIADNGNVYPTFGTISINQSEILYVKDSNIKNWASNDEGVVYQKEKDGISFKFHKFFLNKQNKYLYVSYDKIVKHNGVFYYTLIIDGQSQLAS